MKTPACHAGDARFESGWDRHFLKVLMKHIDGKVRILHTEGADVILKTDSGFKFPVPLNVIIGLLDKGYEAITYKSYIRKELIKLNVFTPPADLV